MVVSPAGANKSQLFADRPVHNQGITAAHSRRIAWCNAPLRAIATRVSMSLSRYFISKSNTHETASPVWAHNPRG